MTATKVLVKEGMVVGLNKAWRGFVWLMKLIIPISFAILLISASGLLQHLHFLFGPLMGFLSLPPLAALPLLVGLVAGIYSAIAVMVVLPFSLNEMTLMTIFLLIAHSLVQEGIIQGKSGLNPGKATVFRLLAAIIAVMVAAPFLAHDPSQPAASTSLQQSAPFWKLLKDWSQTTFYLAVKIFIIIMTVITLLEVLKKIGFIGYTIKFFSPLLRVMGLNEKVGIIWIAAVIFGLVYSATVIIEEIKEGNLSREDIEALQLSIGIQHAVIEDPLLFMALGIGAFWIFVPRLLAAIIVVRLVKLWHKLKRNRIAFIP